MDQWLECGCCDVVCPVPTLDYSSKSLTRNVAGIFERNESDSSIVFPIKKWGVKVDNFSANWSKNTDNGSGTTGVGSYIFNYDIDYSYYELTSGALSFSLIDNLSSRIWVDTTFTGSGSGTWVVTKDGTSTVWDAENLPCGKLYNQPYNYKSIDNAVTWNCGARPNPFKWNRTNISGILRSETRPECKATESDGTYNYSTVNTNGESGSRPDSQVGTSFPGETVDEATSYINEVTWGVVIADFDPLFITDASDGASSYTAEVRVGETYVDPDTDVETYYADIPLTISRTLAKCRFDIPTLHGGTWFSIDYDIVKIPDDASPELIHSSGNIEWTGPGEISDPETWFTSWIDLPLIEDHKTEIRPTRYRCYHGGKWQKF